MTFFGRLHCTCCSEPRFTAFLIFFLSSLLPLLCLTYFATVCKYSFDFTVVCHPVFFFFFTSLRILLHKLTRGTKTAKQITVAAIMSNAQLACTYAALILSESGHCDADSICKVTKAAGVEVSHGMASAFASALAGISLEQVLGNISFGGAAAGAAAPAAAAGGAAPAAAASKKEEKKEEEEADDDMGFGLFD